MWRSNDSRGREVKPGREPLPTWRGNRRGEEEVEEEEEENEEDEEKEEEKRRMDETLIRQDRVGARKKHVVPTCEKSRRKELNLTRKETDRQKDRLTDI